MRCLDLSTNLPRRTRPDVSNESVPRITVGESSSDTTNICRVVGTRVSQPASAHTAVRLSKARPPIHRADVNGHGTRDHGPTKVTASQRWPGEKAFTYSVDDEGLAGPGHCGCGGCRRVLRLSIARNIRSARPGNPSRRLISERRCGRESKHTHEPPSLTIFPTSARDASSASLASRRWRRSSSSSASSSLNLAVGGAYGTRQSANS